MCDFEQKTFCGWRNDGQWSIVTSLQTSNGPRRDHTTGFDYGTYVFLRGQSGSKSTLVSPLFKPSSLCEMRIFIYIWGKFNPGEFNIYVRTANNGGDRLLLSIKTIQTQSWQKRIIKVSETSSFQIIIEGVRSTDSDQVIAIDDTSFDKNCVLDDSGGTLPTATPTPPSTTTRNPCNQGFFYCPTNSECISASLVCNFLYDCPDGADEINCGSCDFEKTTCGWYDAVGSLDWIRNTGASSLVATKSLKEFISNNF